MAVCKAKTAPKLIAKSMENIEIYTSLLLNRNPVSPTEVFSV